MEVGCSSLGELKGHRKETGFCPQYNLNRCLEGGVRCTGVFSWYMTLAVSFQSCGDLGASEYVVLQDL